MITSCNLTDLLAIIKMINDSVLVSQHLNEELHPLAY